MSLKTQIQNDMKTYMRNKDKQALACIRLLFSSIRKEEIDGQLELSDEKIVSLIQKMIKQRRESLEYFRQQERTEEVVKEESDIALLQDYLPQALSEEELRSVIRDAVVQVGASSTRDMGKVMQLVLPKVEGRADGKQVSSLVREALNA